MFINVLDRWAHGLHRQLSLNQHENKFIGVNGRKLAKSIAIKKDFMSKKVRGKASPAKIKSSNFQEKEKSKNFMRLIQVLKKWMAN